MATPFFVVYITTPKGAKARTIARRLVEERMAACVNIVPSVRSVYWWEGKVDSGMEALLIAKTHKKQLTTLLSLVKKIHPYTVPEVIALPIVKGAKSYLNWVKKETGSSR